MSSDSTGNFEVFGDYVLLKLLASGGMAEVFLARPTNPNANGRILVVKRILKQIANDPVFIKMFRSEIRVTLGFNHPHAIQLHDFGEIDYQPYIAMEYIEGKSLKQIMEKFAEKGEVIPVPTALGLLAQAASGLGYAHHFENTATGEVVNAIHRDISPHNLLVSYDGNLKVIDFGIAKAKNEISDKTRAGQIKGKCAYLSPEQLKEEVLDGRSDIFSLGIVAWELLTGHRLFHRQGDTELQIIERIQNCDKHIVAPSQVNPDVSKEVDELVLRALEKNRDERYSTAEAFQVAIRKVMHRLYPNYTYADTAQIMRALFESDMMLERMALRDANDRAQEVLAAELDAKTRIVDQAKGGGFFSVFTKKKNLLPSEMEVRVGTLEAALKQKAKFSHYMVAGLYVLSILAIKIDDRYSLLDRFFFPAEVESVLASESSATKIDHDRASAHAGSASDQPPIQRMVPPASESTGTARKVAAPTVRHTPTPPPSFQRFPATESANGRRTFVSKPKGKATRSNRAPASTAKGRSSVVGKGKSAPKPAQRLPASKARKPSTRR